MPKCFLFELKNLFLKKMNFVDENQRAKQANKVTFVGLLVNVLLTIAKFIAGILGHSAAMLADAVHSISDFATDIVVLASFRMVRRPADKTHDYGHGKFETLASTFIGSALAIVGIGLFYSGAKKIWDVWVNGLELEKPQLIALWAAIVSIIFKEFLYQYTKNVGKKINSNAIIANAWHHRSDALSSIGTMIGIGGAILLSNKWTILDPLAAIVVSVFIVAAAYNISLNSIKELLEESLDEKTENEILDTITEFNCAFDPHDLRTRRIGNRIAIDIHLRFKNNLTIAEVHKINDNIELKLREKYGQNTIINLHSEPEFE